MAAEPARRVRLSRIAGAHGLGGEVRLRSFTERPEDIASYGPLEDEAGAARFEIESLRPGKAGLIARLKGVDDREAAEALRGTWLCLPRERLPGPEPESWYHGDLIGLHAQRVNGEALGEVIAVQNFGAGDLIEIRLSGTNRTVLIPFTKTYVPEVDIEGDRVVIAPAEGMIEEAGEKDGQRRPRAGRRPQGSKR